MGNLFGIEGILMVLRWLHFFFGVMWIGHLYYFNFTQGAFMAVADPGTKSGVLTGLLPRALYWFRWGAMWTFVTGILYLGLKGHEAGSMSIYSGSWGVSILIGAVLGITMFLNVWLVIWPNQQVVMKSAAQVAKGGAALPEAAKLAAQATLASRTNTLFSIPMLFFMGAANRSFLPVGPDSKLGLLAGILLILWAALTYNGVKGKLGPMTTIKGVITCGFVLTFVIIGITELVLNA